jgi:hypothetical protein
MTQAKTFGWTNPASAVARNQSVGFSISEITTIDVTNGGSFYWNSSMPDDYYLDVDAGTITTSNGFTPYNSGALFGSAISGFTNAADGVITASNIADVGFVVGDTVKVAGVADDESGTASLNGQYTVITVSATQLTVSESTVGLSVYVSGGVVSRVSDSSGAPIATQNFGIQGITIGSGVVGQNSAVMVANVKGDNSVC